MSYTRETILPVFNKALLQVGILRAAGYDAHIVGGALRTLALGGVTQDVDIAVILPFDELWALRNDVDVLLSPLRMYFDLQHWSGYDDNKGFLADWRENSADINIIAYDNEHYKDVGELVSKFDLNINQWDAVSEHDHELNNAYMVGDKVMVNPDRDHDYQTNRLADRIRRFKDAYPMLDWSDVDD